MDQAVYEKQSAISGKFIAIADDLAERLGLKTRLHKLDIENLAKPECEIGVYTPTDIRIGAIDVRLSAADNKARVTLALFRDLETTVDDWTFDTASKPPSARRRMRCMNPKCSTDEWDGSGFDVEICPGCGQASSTVDHCDRYFPQKDDGSPKPVDGKAQTKCETPRVSQTCPKHGAFDSPTCPECTDARHKATCSMHGGDSSASCPECVAVSLAARRMRCTNAACRTGEWDGGGHSTELCPSCRKPGERVAKSGA